VLDSAIQFRVAHLYGATTFASVIGACAGVIGGVNQWNHNSAGGCHRSVLILALLDPAEPTISFLISRPPCR